MINEKRLIERIKWSLIVIKGHGTDVNFKEVIEKDKLLKIINEQPKAAEWIPCSERLPSEAELWDNMENEFIVMIKGVELPTALFYDADYEEWSDGEDVYEVIAWMPLPDAYKGE